MTPARLALLRTALIAVPLAALWPLAGCAGGGNGQHGDTACSDGIDNDADGLVDYPADPGCSSADDNDETDMPQCGDGIDNDGDGKIDFPNDPGCLNANQNSETDDCPDGPNCPECGNGKDDDGDGAIDYPADDGCSAASDDSEVAFDANACGAGVTVQPLPPDGNATGMIVAGASHLSSPGCGGAGAEVAYALTVSTPTTVVATTAIAGTGADTVLYLRSDCIDYQTELGCNDNASSGSGGSTLIADVAPGTYYLIVDGQASTTSGNFNLEVTRYPGQGEPCDPVTDGCAPGHYCRPLPGGTDTVCTAPRCSDGLDDDADGKTDYPDDPGCTDPTDDDETDNCPDGADCPACANGIDDDSDGQTDYPADPDCKSASQPIEGCGSEQDPLGLVTSGTMTGDTTSYHDDFTPSCGYTGGPDAVYLLEVPALDSLTLSTAGSSFDTVLALYDSTCGGTDLGCNDEDSTGTGTSLVGVTNVPAGTYAAVVDGYDDLSYGSYQLAVSGVITTGGRCDGALFAAGALTCAPGTACDGSTCKGMKACNDGVDDDADGKVDYPDDPGCDSPTDDDETDDCPDGPTCPACSNGIDDDSNGKTDYPDDPDCASASQTIEAGCGAEQDPVAAIVGSVSSGDTSTYHDDFTLCAGTGGNDAVYLFDVPTLESLTLSTDGSSFDTVLAVYDSTCGGTALGCNDDDPNITGPSLLTLSSVPAGRYAAVVDGYDLDNYGSVQLHASGVIAAGGRCDGGLYTAGVLTCTTGTTCDGTICKGMLACNDGVDDDGDGLVDYPDDPGCTSPLDDDETDDCPDGPSCPACANGQDDDGDGLVDYPDDTSCTSASGTSEDCVSTEGVTPLTMPSTTGTTTGATNDTDPACASASGSGPDVVYALELPALSSLTIDQSGAFDSVIELLGASCGGTALDCEDFPEIVATSVAAGRYYLVVDGWADTESGDFQVDVTGTIAPHGACDVPLATSGALTCGAGYTCQGTGAMTCEPTACNDGVDDDGDGLADYPDDPGCTGIDDDDETDDCPDGPSCPACANGQDDDSDGLTDYPADYGCASASSSSEAFCPTESDPVAAIATATTSGTTTGATDDFTPSCSTSTAPDKVYALVLPVAVDTLTIDTNGSAFDTVLSLSDNTCSAAGELDCADDGGSGGGASLLTETQVPPGAYSVIVDGYQSDAGGFLLHVNGIVAPGAACTSPLFASGILTCPAGQTCQSGTCQ